MKNYPEHWTFHRWAVSVSHWTNYEVEAGAIEARPQALNLYEAGTAPQTAKRLLGL